MSNLLTNNLFTDARHLISRLITVDPKKRATLPEVLAHPWVNEGYGSPPPNYVPERPVIKNPKVLSKEIVGRLQAFGYKTEDIEKSFGPEADYSRPDPIRATYFLLIEMLQREELKLRNERRKQQQLLDSQRSSYANIPPAYDQSHAHNNRPSTAASPRVSINHAPPVQAPALPYYMSSNAHPQSFISPPNTSNPTDLLAAAAAAIQREEARQNAISAASKKEFRSLQALSTRDVQAAVLACSEEEERRRMSASGHIYNPTTPLMQAPPQAVTQLHVRQPGRVPSVTATSRKAPSISLKGPQYVSQPLLNTDMETEMLDESYSNNKSRLSIPSPANYNIHHHQPQPTAMEGVMPTYNHQYPIQQSQQNYPIGQSFHTATSVSSIPYPSQYQHPAQNIKRPSTAIGPTHDNYSQNTVTGQHSTTKDEVRSVSGWFLNVSTTSSKPPHEILTEVLRVLNETGVRYVHDGRFTVTCEADVTQMLFPSPQQPGEMVHPGTQKAGSTHNLHVEKMGSSGSSSLLPTAKAQGVVIFQIEVCKIPRMNLHGLHFKRINGGVWSYKKCCNKLLSMMAL
jgi:MAP/microtubule affinity-regulating kinase